MGTVQSDYNWTPPLNEGVTDMDSRIEQFMTTLKHQLVTSEEADKVVEELNDHIQCLIEDYEEGGMPHDGAVEKSLQQMGDPLYVGYAFNNPDIIRQRHRLLIGFKIIGFLVFCFGFLALYLIDKSEAIIALSGLLPLIIYFAFLTHLLQTQSLGFIGQRSKYIDIDTQPLMILWPAKNKLSRDTIFIWSFIILIFSPIAIFFLFALIAGGFEETGSFVFAFFLPTVPACSILCFIISERFRLPKAVLLSDGLLIKGYLIPWIGIYKVRWHMDYMNQSGHAKLELLNMKGYPLAPKVKVHKDQLSFVRSILNEQVSL